jgi:hypothetical protein
MQQRRPAFVGFSLNGSTRLGLRASLSSVSGWDVAELRRLSTSSRMSIRHALRESTPDGAGRRESSRATTAFLRVP